MPEVSHRPLAHSVEDIRPLHQLCREGRLYDVERWIADGKPLQLMPEALPKGARPKTALQIALQTGQHSLATFLLRNGYLLELERYGPLDLALRSRRWDLFDLLLEWGGDEKRFHDEMIGGLQREYTKVQNRLDAMYLDKLDGRISQEFFDGKSTEWRKEQDDILRKIVNHQNANRSFLDDGVRILELSQRAVSIYEKQEMREKRKLLNFMCSNSTWKDGTLTPKYRKPFDMIADTNSVYKKEQAASPEKSGLNDIWLPGQDSNLQPSG